MGLFKSKLEEEIEKLLEKDQKELLFLLKDLDEICEIVKTIHLQLNQIFSQIIQLKAEMYRKKKEYGKILFRIENNTRLLSKKKDIENKIAKLEVYLDEVIKREKHEINIEKIIRSNLDTARKKLDELQ